MTDPMELFRRGDYAAAAEALLPLYRQNMRNSMLALFTGAALFKSGRKEEAVAVWSLGDEAGPVVRGARRDQKAPPGVRALSAEADQALRDYLTALHVKAAEECNGDVVRVKNAVWTQTHNKPFQFLIEAQAPTIFYMPDLPAAPVTPKDAFDWAAGLEAAGPAIAAEYAAAVEHKVQQTPYVPAGTPSPQWAKLRGTLDWSALHLFDKTKRTAIADRFPKTLEALEKVGLVRIDGVPVEAFFSRLKPGAHIPPHFGLTNARLTVHLPLIVPEDCAIRVADKDYHWTENEIIAFDDSYRHEAWNYAPTDRVVLIFECYHPDLTADERSAIEHTWAARQHWIKNRLKIAGAA